MPKNGLMKMEPTTDHKEALERKLKELDDASFRHVSDKVTGSYHALVNTSTLWCNELFPFIKALRVAAMVAAEESAKRYLERRRDAGT